MTSDALMALADVSMPSWMTRRSGVHAMPMVRSARYPIWVTRAYPTIQPSSFTALAYVPCKTYGGAMGGGGSGSSAAVTDDQNDGLLWLVDTSTVVPTMLPRLLMALTSRI